MWIRGERPVLRELVQRNIRRCARDYQIYFVTLTLAVAMFYTFNSIEAQFAVLLIPDTMSYLSFAVGMIAAVSLFICLIMGFLVVYANRFMLKRRKREIGVYLTLGMEERAIGGMLWKETVLIGGISLGTGLALGLVLSQGLSMITAKIAGVGLEWYRFVWSWKAMSAAVFFFGCIFFVVCRFNRREIRKMNLMELLQADRKNEPVSRNTPAEIFMFFLAVFLLAAGYGCIFYGTGAWLGRRMLAGACLTAAGTMLFCISVSGLYVHICRRNKSYYYSRLHIFVVNQLGSRLRNAGASIGIVSILVTLSITSMALGLLFGSYVIGDSDRLAPYDISIWISYGDGKGSLSALTVEEAVRRKWLELTDYVGESAEFRVYTAEGITNLIFSHMEQEEFPLKIIGVGDYNRMMRLQGEPAVVLGDREYAVSYNEKGAEEKLKTFMEQEKSPLHINKKDLFPAKDGLYNQVYFNNNVLGDSGTLIIPQNVAEGLPLAEIGYGGMFKSAEAEDAFEAAYLNIPTALRVTTRREIMTEVTSAHLAFSYIGIYLGVSYLISAGAVLALQQLTQSSENEKRYCLLKKLGTGAGDLRESLSIQLRIYFGLPSVLAVVNSAFIISGIYGNLSYVSAWTAFRMSAIAAGLAAMVFSLYYGITYSGTRRILKIH